MDGKKKSWTVKKKSLDGNKEKLDGKKEMSDEKIEKKLNEKKVEGGEKLNTYSVLKMPHSFTGA